MRVKHQTEHSVSTERSRGRTLGSMWKVCNLIAFCCDRMSQAPSRAFCLGRKLEGASERESISYRWGKLKCVTAVQFESTVWRLSILLRLNESQAWNRAFGFDRMLEGTIDRGVKFLLQTQYGKVKRVKLYYLKAFYLDRMQQKNKHFASTKPQVTRSRGANNNIL